MNNILLPDSEQTECLKENVSLVPLRLSSRPCLIWQPPQGPTKPVLNPTWKFYEQNNKDFNVK